MSLDLSWIEISAEALEKNVATFRRIVGRGKRLLAVVKGNAYGHGMQPVAEHVLSCGVDWLGVFSFDEAVCLREAGIEAPILVMGPFSAVDLKEASRSKITLTVASTFAIDCLLRNKPDTLDIHIKLETGTNRQGLAISDYDKISELSKAEGINIEGAYTHYADIEDTTDHSFADSQYQMFKHNLSFLSEAHDIRPVISHTACTAAALLFPHTLFDMARVGIGLYGLWPSKETLVSAGQLGREIALLHPVMTWKTRVIQLKKIESDEYVGYGRTFRTTRPTTLAILPIGYANGYDRKLSNRAYVLIEGRRAPVVGRICMNLSMVDVTDIEGVKEGAEVVLLGGQQSESISAETLASWQGTISYEIVTRADPQAARILV